MEVRAGRHHRVDGVFLLHAKIDQRAALAPGGRHGIGNLAARADGGTPDAVRSSQLLNVRSGDRRRRISALVKELLPLPHHAEVAVVMTAIFTSISSCTIVASSHSVIWKPPSPTITHTSASGRPTFAPMAAGRANPIVPRPPDVMSERGDS